MVAGWSLAVGERADEVDLGEHQVVHPRRVASWPQIATLTTVPPGRTEPIAEAEHRVDAGALERDVRARAAGEVADRVGHVRLGRVEHHVGARAAVALALRAAAGSTDDHLVRRPTALSAAVVTSPIGPAPNTAAVPPGLIPDSRTAW